MNGTILSFQVLKALVPQGRNVLDSSIQDPLIPEPIICKGHARKGRHVAVLRNLLSGILLKRLHIGIVESARRILTGVEVTEQTIGLQVLDMLIDLLKRYLLIRDAAPRRIPSVGDEDIHLSIAREQLRQLILDELYLRRSHVEMADIVAQRQDRIIEPHPQASPAKRIHI